MSGNEEAHLAVGGREVQWEWEGDGAKWTGYSSKHAQQITDAYSNSKKEVNN